MKKFVCLMVCLVTFVSMMPIVRAESVQLFAIEPRYDDVLHFNEGLAAVEKDGKWGLVDKTGKEVVKPQYDYMIQFSDGIASVVKDGKLGYVDTTGKTILKLQYDGNYGDSHFNEGLARVNKDGNYGYIDLSGKEVIPVQYEKATDFREGLAAVKKDGKWAYIDKAGHETSSIQPDYEFVQDISQGLAQVAKNNKWGFIDKTGKEVIPLQYQYAQNFTEGLSMATKNDKRGYIDRTGKEVIPLQYEDAGYFLKGQPLARVKKDGKWGFIDAKGKEVIPRQYEEAKDFSYSDDLAPVKLNGKWGFIDLTGKMVIPADFEDAQSFTEGMAAVKKNGKWGFVADPLGPKKPQSREPNVVFDYKALAGLKTTEEFAKSLDNALSALKGEKPNDAGNAAITQNIEYAMQTAVQGAVAADKNVIAITGGKVKEVWTKLDAAHKKYDELLHTYGITLDKNVGQVLRINGDKVDMSKPVTIRFDKNIMENIGSADGILVSLDGKHAVSLTNEDLKQLISKPGAAAVQVEKKANTGSYAVTFLDSSSHSLDQIANPFTFTLPADSPYATVFANYKGGSDNWGGQYDAVAGTIRFATKFSGEYSILTNQTKISDTGKLPEDVRKAINFMVSKGYFALDGEAFKPDGLIDRNSFTMALVKMFFALDRGLQSTFADVERTNEFYPYIASAKAGDIVKGYEDNTFRGSSNVLLEQVIALCSRTLVEKKGYNYPANPSEYLNFTDAGSISDWAEKDVALAVRAGLIDSGGALHPQTAITRGQAADILYKLFMLLYDTPPASIQPDVNVNHAPDNGQNTSAPAAGSSTAVYPVMILAALLLAAGGAAYWRYAKKKKKIDL